MGGSTGVAATWGSEDAAFSDTGRDANTTFDAAGAAGGGGSWRSVSASGDQRIDGLLVGLKWSGRTITYTDPDAASDYPSGYVVDFNNNGISAQNEGFGRIGASQLLAVRFALDTTTYTQPAGGRGFSVEGFTSLSIAYDGPTGSGMLRIANTSDNQFGYAFYPGGGIQPGDAWLGTQIQSPVQGNYEWNNTLHELGHTLGLKHGQETGGPANQALPNNVNSLEYTVMTYRSYVGSQNDSYSNDTWSYPQTYMMLDIAALQYMYGADFSSSAANAGNTVYRWSPTNGQSTVNDQLATDPGANKIFETIWDGGGSDTYDLSNYRTSQTIDLTPGGHSTFSPAQLADLGDGNSARGNVFNALQYQGDARSLIENAKGGSANDTIKGNDAENRLDGGKGADTLNGGKGNDTYVVDSTADKVIESASRGYGDGDRIEASVSIKLLAANVEDLVLTGTGNLSATGNGSANHITGNARSNILDGGAGKDELYGGAGNDSFLFATAPSASNRDTIEDFKAADDTIRLENAIFKALTETGTLDDEAFDLITSASEIVSTDAHILYNKQTGALYYDANGGGSSGRIPFAVIDNHSTVTFQDILVV